jgi:hypothetical protein
LSFHFHRSRSAWLRTSAQNRKPKQNAPTIKIKSHYSKTMNTQPFLERLSRAETEIDIIQRTPDVKREYPQAWQILEEIRGLLNAAHIKFNYGDDKN